MSNQATSYTTLIRQRGFRVTPQRQLIMDAIQAGAGHTTPEEIYERVHLRAPAVNRATVYRNLDFLCEMRLVVAARIGSQMLYELAGKEPHHHLICRSCDRIEPLSHQTVKEFFDQIQGEQAFQIDMDHLTLFGLCKTCQRPSRKKILMLSKENS